MTNRLSKSLIMVLASVGSLLTFAAPASADHGPLGHWGGGFDPWVEPAPHLAGVTWAAVDAWNAFGVRSQMNKGVQDGDCNVTAGEISVCGRNAGFVSFGQTFGTCNTCIGGWAQNYSDSSGHTSASVVELCQNCGWGNAIMQYLASHELGHAMGLDHTRTDCNSAVNNIGCQPPWPSNPHERDSLRFWYNHAN